MQGSVTGEVFKEYLDMLVKELQQSDKHRREKVCIICDNVAVDKTDTVMKFAREMRLPLLFSGKASCESAPVEKVFAHVKRAFAKECEQR